ncbi:Myc-type, basic helix-loop-helix (bHLH) domain-containing protein [Strongyloides ratti]|uniref:Myc-type, basic helix-loop-helix (BHLH) domain-containing protein n=1 Tax=Strongyloides ratti TaxID=34506 RepID=A0A090LFC6_STRRB|nr:Myc-type, basic helix-loop-helix (bHLH) domain-containing protein [Strongyloides ratti]CEF68472.1 Myc-type, basic helix-loop-helix (bHLH) domain-containing protein [Strongyloides ratti]
MFSQNINVSPTEIFNGPFSNNGMIDIQANDGHSTSNEIFSNSSLLPIESKILIETPFVPRKRGRKRKCDNGSGIHDEESAVKHAKQIEKVRNTQINIYFDHLQKLVPFVPEKQRLPKIKLLKLTMRYIEHLKKCINGELIVDKEHSSNGYDYKRVITREDFKQTAIEELQHKNSYISRANEELKRWEEIKSLREKDGRSSADSQTSASTHSLDGNSNLTTIGNICYETVNTNNYNFNSIIDNNYHYPSHSKNMMVGF